MSESDQQFNGACCLINRRREAIVVDAVDLSLIDGCVGSSCSIARAGVNTRATIGFEGKRYRLGTYPTKEAAHAAYCEASTRLHGDFARVA